MGIIRPHHPSPKLSAQEPQILKPPGWVLVQASPSSGPLLASESRGVGFRVWGLGLGVSGVGFRVGV